MNPTPARQAGVVALLVFTGCELFAGPSQLPPGTSSGSGAFSTGHYRNLFVETGHPEVEITNKINAAFQQLFHGNPARQTVYYGAGTNSNGPLAYVTDINHQDVRTEGLSYGMMIAVQMNRKAEFDALWNWSMTYLYHDAPTHPSYGFFSWQARTNGSVLSEFVAPDGESYYVMALYFAANRWGNGTGIYNYRAEADRLLSNLRHRALINGRVFTSHRGTNRMFNVTAGPLFNAEHKMVVFSPSSERPQFTDPSYHLPAFYELWARWGPPADKDFWMEAASASRDFFARAAHPATGLTPDYANFDGTAVSNDWNHGAANFRFDAFRTAGNWSVDWSWWGKDVRERELSDRLQAFFKSKGMDGLRMPVHPRRPAAGSTARPGVGGNERRGQPRRHESAGQGIRRSVVEHAGSGRRRALLRRPAVYDGTASLRR